jgi:hypothetical protein
MRTDVQQTIYPEQGDVHAKVRLLPDFSSAWPCTPRWLYCTALLAVLAVCWLCAGYVLAGAGRAGCISCPGCARTNLAVLAALYTRSVHSPFAAYPVLAVLPALAVHVFGCCI